VTGEHPGVHPTAIVEPGARLGSGVRIWHWVHVRAGAVIGDDTSIGQGCYIDAIAIGRGCRIQNHVSLFAGVTLDDDVFLGPSCVFTNVQHPRAHISRKDSYAPTRVGRGATIGANATIVCGVVIGAHAMIGAGAVVTRDVPPHAVMIGAPARAAGWACRCGETLASSSEAERDATAAFMTARCDRCGDRYAVMPDAATLLTAGGG
jgi:UDP-2-acetamido-3-amino-2,3-dideoxy-glucuronate N-acetyltransferase